MQKEAEDGWMVQENLNEEFSEELAKIAAALNNSFSHWKELQVQKNGKKVQKLKTVSFLTGRSHRGRR